MKKLSFRKVIFLTLLSLFIVFIVWRMIRPMNIFIVEERFARPIHVETPHGLHSVSAEGCRNCHEEIYLEWSESMHAKAWTDPYFQVDYVFDGSQQICLNCHIPLENQQENLVAGFRDRARNMPILTPNPDFDPALQSEGVTCVVCHLRDGKIAGPLKTEHAPHPVVFDPEMSSGMKTCERCHVVSGDRWDTFYKIPPCGTVAEIEAGGREPDCVGCHMPEVKRPIAAGMKDREGRMHLFRGGHHPETVRNALTVDYNKETDEDENTVKITYTLTNTGTAHYLPTGTPDRHLTLELKLLDNTGSVIKDKTYKMKRYILWRPFIVDIRDTRLPYGEPRSFVLKFRPDNGNPPFILDTVVRYHLLDEKRRKKIGYDNKEPISYTIYEHRDVFP